MQYYLYQGLATFYKGQAKLIRLHPKVSCQLQRSHCPFHLPAAMCHWMLLCTSVSQTWWALCRLPILHCSCYCHTNSCVCVAAHITVCCQLPFLYKQWLPWWDEATSVRWFHSVAPFTMCYQSPWLQNVAMHCWSLPQARSNLCRPDRISSWAGSGP